MQKQNDWSTFASAKSSILALLFEDTYRYTNDIDEDLKHVAPTYYNTWREIEAAKSLDSDAQTQLKGLLHIVIAEMLFKHIGVELLDGNLAKLSATMTTICERFSHNGSVKKLTETNSTMEDDAISLLVHLNSRILHNIAMISCANLPHRESLFCETYIRKWSNVETPNAILSTHTVTHTIAKNIIRLLTPADINLIKEKANIPPAHPFPKLYYLTAEQIENKKASNKEMTENLLTRIINSTDKSPQTLDKRLALYFQEAHIPKKFFYDLRPDKKVEQNNNGDIDLSFWLSKNQ